MDNKKMSVYDFVDILKVIKTDSKDLNGIEIWAHTSEKKKNETLTEHTECSIKYFKRLAEERNLNVVFNNFTNKFFSEDEVESKLLFEKLLINIVNFHDFGKINPSYQKNVLGNKKFPQFDIECLDGNRHSILSAAIYFDYFINEVNQTQLEERKKRKLKYFVFLNSYIISRHHSDLGGTETGGNPLDAFRRNFLKENEIFNILISIKEGKFSSLYYDSFSNNIEITSVKYSTVIENGKNAFYDSFDKDRHKWIALYVYSYIRFMYSILISCDYYATSEYKCGVEIRDYGSLNEIDEINNVYENTHRIQRIRENNLDKDDSEDINVLRNAMFLECEENLLKNKGKQTYFLEAPTGSGKSNMSVNASLKLLDETIKKIIYVYPFNTLIEQNIKSLNTIFEGSHVMNKVSVINSIYPIKKDRKKFETLKSKEDEEQFYQRILLDRQFLNYPFILTTHVNLFDIMFGCSKEAAISFYQLSNSVIVLDEIQSYKNDIWAEIMYFLKSFSEILNIKVVIMSATLPRIDYLTEIENGIHENADTIHLITNRSRYFEDKRFRKRVNISFELLNHSMDNEALSNHIVKNSGNDRNILVEFIKKNSTYEFYDFLLNKDLDNINIYCLTGDYNQADRERVLKKISESKGNILIATQVIEAGVDIDMDIGYKDISKLDSEEQFLGRINRNYRSEFGKAFFFKMDSASGIYKNDFRIEPEYTIIQPEMQEILLNKRFDLYYSEILKRIKLSLNMRLDKKGIDSFIAVVEKLDFYEIQKRMELIKDDDWNVSVFIPRIITLSDGTEINGNDVWEEYKQLLADKEMEYAKKQVELSEVKSKFSYFVYKVNRTYDFNYNDRIGEMYFLQDGEQYLKEGHLDFEGASLFV